MEDRQEHSAEVETQHGLTALPLASQLTWQLLAGQFSRY